MNDRKLRAYDVVRRLARVREMRAAASLSMAIQEERMKTLRLDEASAACDAVAVAAHACVESGVSVDIPRYVTLLMLDESLTAKQQDAASELASAAQAREVCATSSWLAKRYRERVGEHVKETRQMMYRDRAARLQEEGVELWMHGKEGA